MIPSTRPPLPTLSFAPAILIGDARAAAHIVLKCCRLAEDLLQSGDYWTAVKPDGSKVTSIDYVLKTLASRWLSDRFPHDGFMGEETAESLYDLLIQGRPFSIPGKTRIDNPYFWIDRVSYPTSGARTWVLDPIDATYYMEQRDYAINLALINEGVVQLSAIGFPHLRLPQFPQKEGLLLMAIKGYGSWAAPLDGSEDFKRLCVSARGPQEAILLRSLVNLSHGEVNPGDRAFLQTLYGGFPEERTIQAPSPRRYALLAGGVGDIVMRAPLSLPWTRQLQIWDHAPYSLLVEEAGGKVTDLLDRPLDFSVGPVLGRNFGILGSNGRLHDLGLSAYRGALDTFPMNHKEVSCPAVRLDVAPVPSRRGLIRIEGRTAHFRPPYLAIFDIHGTTLEPNWKESLEQTYCSILPHRTAVDAAAWVAENTYGISDQEVFARLARLKKGLTPKTAADRFYSFMDERGETEFPQPMRGIPDLFSLYRRKDVPIVTPTYAAVGRTKVLAQLRNADLLDLIGPKNVVTRDNMPAVRDKDEFRKEAILALKRRFHGTILFYNDTPDGMATVKELGGINFGVPQGTGLTWELNRRRLIDAGADFLIEDWAVALPELEKQLFH